MEDAVIYESNRHIIKIAHKCLAKGVEAHTGGGKQVQAHIIKGRDHGELMVMDEQLKHATALHCMQQGTRPRVLKLQWEAASSCPALVVFRKSVSQDGHFLCAPSIGLHQVVAQAEPHMWHVEERWPCHASSASLVLIQHLIKGNLVGIASTPLSEGSQERNQKCCWTSAQHMADYLCWPTQHGSSNYQLNVASGQGAPGGLAPSAACDPTP